MLGVVLNTRHLFEGPGLAEGIQVPNARQTRRYLWGPPTKDWPSTGLSSKILPSYPTLT